VFDPADLALFALASLLLTVTPGPAVLYIVARSISQGRTAGVVSCLGITAGGLVHVVASAAGLSAIFATSALAFGAVKYAGAAYLVWLGVRRLARPAEPVGDGTEATPVPLAAVFYQGLLVNVLNPKTALFFLAFLPQFVSPARGDVALQVTALGGLFLGIAWCTDAVWALLASRAGSWLKRHPWYLASERYLVGSVYLGLGLATALSGPGRR